MERYQVHELLARATGKFVLRPFESLGLAKMIEASLDQTDSWEKNDCVLKAPLVMCLVLCMSLMRNLAIYDVFQAFVSTLRSSPKLKKMPLRAVTEEALYHARARLGVAPVKALFEMTTKQIQQKPWFFGRRIHSVDGTNLVLYDSPENAAFFGKPNIVNGEAAFPQAKCVAMVSTETRELEAVEFGPYGMPEQPSVARFAELLGPEDLLLMDRGIPSFALFEKLIARGVDFVARIAASWKPRVLIRGGDGDSLVEIKTRIPILSANQRRRKGQTHMTVYMVLRMIQYTFESTGETIRLLTSIMDPDDVPARALAMLYHERWESEIVFDELKTHLQSIPHGTVKTVLRSKTPDGVIQEGYGMVTVYNLARKLMAKAGRRAKIDPDTISFVGTLNVIKLAIPRMASAPKVAHKWLARQLMDDIAGCKLKNPRRKRKVPRCVRIKFVRFPKRRPDFKETHFDFEAELRLVDSDFEPLAA